jgi:hypothetical protein
MIRKNMRLKQRRKLDKMVTNLSISNYQKNMVLTTSAVYNSNCCLNYRRKRCWSCCNIKYPQISGCWSFFIKKKTSLVQKNKMETKLIYNRRTNQLIEELGQFLCIFLAPPQTHYMGGYLGKS